MRIYTTLFTAAAIAVLAGTAISQPPPGGGRGFGMGMAQQIGNAALIANASVQEELKVTDEQKEKFKKFRESLKDKNEAMKAAREDQDREKMAAIGKEIAEETDKAIKEILTADQMKRLQQIKWQQGGIMAVASDEELVKALKVTDDQKAKFKELREEMMKDMREMAQGSGGDFKEMRTKGEALMKEYREKAEEVLTAEQKAEFKKLKGEPFELKMERGQFGPGGKGGDRKIRGEKGEKKKIDD